MKILNAQRKAFKKEKSEAIKQATDSLIQSFRKEIKTIGSQAYSILDSAQGWRSFKVLSKWYSAKALETSRLHTV